MWVHSNFTLHTHTHPHSNILGYTGDTRGDARGDTQGNAIGNSIERFLGSSFTDDVTHAGGDSELEGHPEPVLVVDHHLSRCEPVGSGSSLPALILEL